jgi:hypothetical protein
MKNYNYCTTTATQWSMYSSVASRCHRMLFLAESTCMPGLPDDDSPSQPGLKDTIISAGLTLMPLTMCTALLQHGCHSTHKRCKRCKHI